MLDFVQRCLDTYHQKLTWTDISLPLQKYYFASKVFSAKKKAEKGGPQLKFKLRTANQGNAAHSGLYAVEDTDRKDVLTEGKQGWSKQRVCYTFDIDEDEFSSAPEELIDGMKEREFGLYADYFELMETATWTAPSSSTLSPMPPAGIPFWFQKNSTDPPGFNGGDPDGWTDGAGSIATATYKGWKNWTGPYVQVNRDDLIAKVVKACDFTSFGAPVPYPETGGGQPQWGFYTVYSVFEQVRRDLELQNDNLGREAAWGSMRQPTIHGIEVMWVPALDNEESAAYDSSNPFYGVNWSKFRYFFQKNRNNIKMPLQQANSNQPTVRVRWMFNWGNFICEDRRQGGFVLYVA
jgi:hypothetical protein